MRKRISTTRRNASVFISPLSCPLPRGFLPRYLKTLSLPVTRITRLRALQQWRGQPFIPSVLSPECRTSRSRPLLLLHFPPPTSPRPVSSPLFLQGRQAPMCVAPVKLRRKAKKIGAFQTYGSLSPVAPGFPDRATGLPQEPAAGTVPVEGVDADRIF